MKLIIEDDEGRKTVVPIGREEVSIGRQDGCTVRLAERNVSRRHALLVRQNGAIVIEDLNSFNGVRVNGDRIQGRSQVHEGDLIQIGDYDLAIEREADQPEPEGRQTEPEMARVRAPGYDLTPASVQDTTPPTSGERRSQETAVIKSPFGPGDTGGAAAPLSAEDQPRLVFLNTNHRGREILIEQTVVTLGRGAGNEISIDHRSMSKEHARLSRDHDGTWHLTDLKSANGVRVNGETYSRTPLSAGDVVELGHVQLKFVGPGERFTLTEPPPRKGLPLTRLSLVGGATAVAVVGALLFFALRHRESTPLEVADSLPTPPPHQQPTLAPVPAAPLAPPPAPPPMAAAAPAPAATQAQIDADRANQAIAQTKALVKAKRWDKADEKLKEAEAVDSEDSAVTRLRKEIDGAREREIARAAKPERKHKPPPSPSPPAPSEDAEADPAPAPGSRAERKAKAQASYEEAIGSIGGGDYVGALAKLEHVLELDPLMAEAHKGMGICYAHLREPDKGAYHYEQYLKLKPGARDAADVKKMLADYYKSRGP